jgi:D-glycero-D-manno-heptose 1,7-bisphosphate phosphatase
VGINNTRELKRAVFLDRDGVVNEAEVKDGRPYSPADATSLRIAAGAAESLARLRQAGYLLLVVTNQPDVARGKQTRQAVEEMNQRIRAELPVDDVLACYHDDDDYCDCRKPKPGLILQAARQCGIDLEKSFMVGDRWRDIDAGANAGCKTILIDFGYRERAPVSTPDYRARSLSEAADWILKNG